MWLLTPFLGHFGSYDSAETLRMRGYLRWILCAVLLLLLWSGYWKSVVGSRIQELFECGGGFGLKGNEEVSDCAWFQGGPRLIGRFTCQALLGRAFVVDLIPVHFIMKHSLSRSLGVNPAFESIVGSRITTFGFYFLVG